MIPAFSASSVFSIWDDNDFRWSDKYYTNHTRCSFSFADEKNSGRTYFASFGQEIYSPANHNTLAAPRGDHPYCGYLYLSGGLTEFFAPDRYFSVELQAGVIGPSSGAHGTQRDYHNLIGEAPLSGWGSQVRDQPGINLQLELGQRFVLAGTPGDGYASDLLTRQYLSLGTVRDVASLGVQWRWGKNLPRDLGYRSMRYTTASVFVPAETKNYYYAFVDFHVDAVAYDVTLGGEMLRDFRDDTGITPYPFSFELSFGVAVLFGERYLLTVGEHFRRKDFVSADHLYFAYTGARLSFVF